MTQRKVLSVLRLWALALGLWTCSAVAVPVAFPMQHFAGQTALKRTLLITPDHPYKRVDTNIVSGQPISLIPTNGLGVVDLVPDGYTVAVDGISGSFHITVTNFNGTLNAADISDNLTTADSASAPGVVKRIIAGDNVTIAPTTGVGVVTINATGGSGGGITLSQGTNIVNGATGVIATNGNHTTFKFTSTGTNAISAIAQAMGDARYDAINSAMAVQTALTAQLAGKVDTVNGFASGTSITNATVYPSKLFPRIVSNMPGLVGWAGPGHLTNTLADGFTTAGLRDHDSLLWNNNLQLTVMWVENGSNVWVFEPAQISDAGSPYYTVGLVPWGIYVSPLRLYDVNTNLNQTTAGRFRGGHTSGAIDSAGGISLSTGDGLGAEVDGFSFGFEADQNSHGFRWGTYQLGGQYFWELVDGGNGVLGNLVNVAWGAPYQSLDVLSNGYVGGRGLFTNEFGPNFDFAGDSLTLGSSGKATLRGNADLLEQRNGANRQTFNIYQSFTDSSNYKRLSSWFNSFGDYFSTAEGSGTGTNAGDWYFKITGGHSLRFWTRELERWRIGNDGVFDAGTDNAYDIGRDGANRPKTIYAGTSVVTPLIDMRGGMLTNVGVLVLSGTGPTTNGSSVFNGDITQLNGSLFSTNNIGSDSTTFLMDTNHNFQISTNGDATLLFDNFFGNLTLQGTLRATNISGILLTATNAFGGTVADFNMPSGVTNLAGDFTFTDVKNTTAGNDDGCIVKFFAGGSSRTINPATAWHAATNWVSTLPAGWEMDVMVTRPTVDRTNVAQIIYP